MSKSKMKHLKAINYFLLVLLLTVFSSGNIYGQYLKTAKKAEKKKEYYTALENYGKAYIDKDISEKKFKVYIGKLKEKVADDAIFDKHLSKAMKVGLDYMMDNLFAPIGSQNGIKDYSRILMEFLSVKGKEEVDKKAKELFDE